MSNIPVINTNGSSNRRVDISIRLNKNKQNINTSTHVAEGSRVVTHADTADKLCTPRIISLIGDITGEGLFDGSHDTIIQTTVNSDVIGAMSNEDIDNIISYTDDLIDS